MERTTWKCIHLSPRGRDNKTFNICKSPDVHKAFKISSPSMNKDLPLQTNLTIKINWFYLNQNWKPIKMYHDMTNHVFDTRQIKSLNICYSKTLNYHKYWEFWKSRVAREIITFYEHMSKFNQKLNLKVRSFWSFLIIPDHAWCVTETGHLADREIVVYYDLYAPDWGYSLKVSCSTCGVILPVSSRTLSQLY